MRLFSFIKAAAVAAAGFFGIGKKAIAQGSVGYQAPPSSRKPGKRIGRRRVDGPTPGWSGLNGKHVLHGWRSRPD